MHYRGKLFRALNPIYTRDPLSGYGAELHGGRFNAKGRPALYMSLSIVTALREANQVGDLQPTTLVSYEADIESVFDAREEAALESFGMNGASLADPTWRDQMKGKGKAATQEFAEQLIARRFHGLLVRSVAPAATEDDLNLVLWTWGGDAPCRLILIDDEGRLASRA